MAEGTTWRVDASGSGFVETRTAEIDDQGVMRTLTIEVTLPDGTVTTDLWLRQEDGSILHSGTLAYPDGRTTIVAFPAPGGSLAIVQTLAEVGITATKTWTYGGDGSAVAEDVRDWTDGTVTGKTTVRSSLLTDGSLSGDSTSHTESTDAATGHRTVKDSAVLASGARQERVTVFDADGRIIDDVLTTHVPQEPPPPPPREKVPSVPTPPPVEPVVTGGAQAGPGFDQLPTFRLDLERDGIILDWWYVDEDGETTYLGSTQLP